MSEQPPPGSGVPDPGPPWLRPTESPPPTESMPPVGGATGDTWGSSQPGPPPSAGVPPPGGGRPKWLVPVIVGVVALLGGIGLGFLLNDDDSETTEPAIATDDTGTEEESATSTSRRTTTTEATTTTQPSDVSGEGTEENPVILEGEGYRAAAWVDDDKLCVELQLTSGNSRSRNCTGPITGGGDELTVNSTQLNNRRFLSGTTIAGVLGIRVEQDGVATQVPTVGSTAFPARRFYVVPAEPGPAVVIAVDANANEVAREQVR